MIGNLVQRFILNRYGSTLLGKAVSALPAIESVMAMNAYLASADPSDPICVTATSSDPLDQYRIAVAFFFHRNVNSPTVEGMDWGRLIPDFPATAGIRMMVVETLKNQTGVIPTDPHERIEFFYDLTESALANFDFSLLDAVSPGPVLISDNHVAVDTPTPRRTWLRG